MARERKFKGNQVATSSVKNTQAILQYHSGRVRPRVSSTYSTSFLLPFGFSMQPTPTTQWIPDSSSFHGAPLESLQLMSENHQRNSRLQTPSSNGQRQQKKYLERQKLKMLKPLTINRNQNNIAKMYEVSTPELTAAILPDPSMSTYRLAHDVSFDEGSRYRSPDGGHGFKGNEMRITSDHGLNGLTRQYASAVSLRNQENGRHELRMSNRDHSSNGSKDFVPVSLVRLEDRCDLPLTTSPSSPALSSAIAASASASSLIPPPSASRQPVPSANSVPSSNITFRLHKEKQNWNFRLGELSINGGGYSSPMRATSDTKVEEPSHRMNVTSAVQRNLQTRERAMAAAPRSRISSRYSTKNDSASSEPIYSDPCISAPPSFHQRLTDLSLLESETIKYERNRKLRRKKNQDKDKEV